MNGKSQPSYDPEERERGKALAIKRIREQAALYIRPDENGISQAMSDKMLAVFSEGPVTGEHNFRSLLYCAYREARKLEP